MKIAIIITAAAGLGLIIIMVTALAKTSSWWSRWEEENMDE